MKLKCFGGRIAVKKIESKLKGNLELPQERLRSFDLAEVVEVGNLEGFGIDNKGSTLEKYNPGDIILFQVPLHIANLQTHKVKDTVTLFLHINDVVARLDDNRSKDSEKKLTVDYNSFHIVGRFVLLEPQIRAPSQLIVVPDNATEMNKETLHFSVLQKGADVTLPFEKGHEVYPNKGRVNTIFVDGKEVCFVDQDAIDAYLDSN